MTNSSRLRRFGVAGLTALALVGSTVAMTSEASARPGFAGGPYRYHGGGYRGHRGLGVGAAVGLGVLGAAAAGVAASQYYNGYPVYSGPHAGYGYDYYPDHGGYYGPY